jgi:hypothetical protein
MSMLTMKSSDSSARSTRAESGVERAGLPAIVMSALIDLFGETHDRQLTEKLREAADTRPSAPEAHTAPFPLPGRARSGRRAREHCAAGSIEVAGADVQHVDEPRRERPELLCARSDTCVHRRGRGGSELVCDASDRRRVDTARTRDRFRRELGCHRAHVVESGDVLRDGAQIDEIVGEQHVHEREQKEGVGSRRDREVFVGFFRGLGSPRIDDDDRAAPFANCPQPARNIRRRHQRAVGRERIGAQHQ